MNKTAFLSIVIPTYNEAKVVEQSISTISSFFEERGIYYEIIISDDGSSDLTCDTVEMLKAENNNLSLLCNSHKGKGGAVREGVLSASGKYIFFLDADLSTPINEITKALKQLEDGFDIVIGSRALSDSKIKVHQPFWRERLGRIFNWIIQLFFVKGIKDTQCGFKGFSNKVAKDLFLHQKISGFSFDVEILCLARKKGYSIKELPVVWINSLSTKVSVLKELKRVIFDLIIIKIRGRR